MSFFDAADALLATHYVLPLTGGRNETLSFLGVVFDSERIGRVRITAGNQVLAGAETGDIVALDDFIYSEPRALAVTSPIPEPSTYALMLAGLCAVGLATRRSRRQASSPTQAT